MPSIDPYSPRTLVVCGFPNVGKSSFMNKVTRADVDVQPYAFTTKSLFAENADNKYMPWQVVDTPGILDRSLEDANAIELLTFEAMGHPNAVLLYFMDLSCQCGYSVDQQASLLKGIAPRYPSRPLLAVLTKCDEQPFDDTPKADQDTVTVAATEAGATIVEISPHSGQGIDDLMAQCEVLSKRASSLPNCGVALT